MSSTRVWNPRLASQWSVRCRKPCTASRALPNHAARQQSTAAQAQDQQHPESSWSRVSGPTIRRSHHPGRDEHHGKASKIRKQTQADSAAIRDPFDHIVDIRSKTKPDLKVLWKAPVADTLHSDTPFISKKDGTLWLKQFSGKKQDFIEFQLSPQWLRDHCHCEKCVHPSTKQRLIETFTDIPKNIRTRSVTETEHGFRVEWSDGHESLYSKEWLSSPKHFGQRFMERAGWIAPVLWDSSIKHNPPTVDYEAVMSSDQGLLEWLTKIRQYGFCYVNNTPASPEETEKLIERIAYIRNTHYGGFWDFTSDLSKGDTAYTQLGIGPHTDNTYFTDAAGLQLFHLLEHTNGEGGTSGLVDGFAAASELKRRDPNAYLSLASITVHSHASGNADSSIQPAAPSPVLVHDRITHGLTQVRWNVTDRAQVDIALQFIDRWYDAARKFSDILEEFQYWEQLVPGKALIFDNWRVLHARSAFTGKRRMCGGYVNRDDFISRFKMLKDGREEVLRQVSAA